MTKIWVINSSPVIFLARINLIHLLSELCPQFVIPAGVEKELQAGEENDQAKIWINESARPHVKALDSVDPIIAAWDLGLGEREVLSYCYQNKDCEAILEFISCRSR